MNKIRYILYFSNNEIMLLDCKRNQIKSDFFLSVANDEILDEQEFHQEFTKFLSQNKIKLSLFGNSLMIITNYKYSKFAINNLKRIFLEYFKNVTFKDALTLLNPTPQKSYLNITTNYIDYYYYKGKPIHQRLNLSLFNKNVFKAINHFILNIYTPKKICIFGNNSDIPTITNKLNKEQAILVTFTENYQSYMLKLDGILKDCKGKT